MNFGRSQVAARSSASAATGAAASAASTGRPADGGSPRDIIGLDRSTSPLLCNDDVLDTIFSLCNLQSIGRLALTCRHLSAFVTDANAIFWLTHLVSALDIPSSEVCNVKLGQDCEARTLLKTLVSTRVRRDNSSSNSNGWEYHRDDNERTIAVEAIGWNRYQIDYVVDDASSVYRAGHDFSVRCHLRPVPAVPSTVVRRRQNGSNALDLTTSSISYFEVNLFSRRGSRQQPADGNVAQAPCVAIGLSTRSFELSRFQPGWTESSIGYHSDDGRIFFSSGSSGTRYGPTYGANDVIGCGVHLPSKSVFYTKNGSLIGTAFVLSNEPSSSLLYPTIGIDSSKYSLHVNFGRDKPFSFDVPIAERLYAAYPPPSRRSRRLISMDNSNAIVDPSAILQQNHLTCEHIEAAAFHPWNSDANTRRIQIDEGAGDDTEDLLEFMQEHLLEDMQDDLLEDMQEDLLEDIIIEDLLDYNSYDDSSVASSDES